MFHQSLILSAALTALASPQRVTQWADYDGDGLRDLVQLGPGQKVRLLRNQGDGSFFDVTDRVGLHDLEDATEALFADYDKDGAQDVLFLIAGDSGRLFRGHSRGTFVSVGAESGLDLSGEPSSAAWIDFDRDGELDLELTTPAGFRIF